MQLALHYTAVIINLFSALAFLLGMHMNDFSLPIVLLYWLGILVNTFVAGVNMSCIHSIVLRQLNDCRNSDTKGTL